MLGRRLEPRRNPNACCPRNSSGCAKGRKQIRGDVLVIQSRQRRQGTPALLSGDREEQIQRRRTLSAERSGGGQKRSRCAEKPSHPELSGTAALGKTLTCSKGEWTGSPTSYAFQWLREEAPISAATGNTYVVKAADQGHFVSCKVIALNGEGPSEPAESVELYVSGIPPERDRSARSDRIGQTTRGRIAHVRPRCMGRRTAPHLPSSNGCATTKSSARDPRTRSGTATAGIRCPAV